MKPILPIFLLSLLTATILITGCSQEDEFASDPIESLRFSADTLTFDTVFSTLGTPTAWLKIYNTGKERIKITGIALQSGGQSGFRINLDGVSENITDVEIPAKDSLFLFVALTPSEQGEGKPVFINDAVVFQTNGKQKQIVLEAYSQDAYIWRGKTITSDTTLTADKPYLIYDSLLVAKNVTLTIKEGVSFYFHHGAKAKIFGTVKAIGTAQEPITFRGDRMDDMLTDFPYDYYPGQWGSVQLKSSSFENEFDYVHIRGGVSGIIADTSSADRSKLKLTNSIIHNMSEYGLFSSNNQISVANCQITNSGLNTVCLIGGTYDFTHCTIANYQRLVTRSSSTLSIQSASGMPLQAEFNNSIVFGSYASEIDTAFAKETSSKLQFRNCLLRSGKLPAVVATNCIYPSDAKFLKLGTEAEKYQYDFRLDSISEARYKAEVTYSLKYPLDMNGVSRIDENIPDMGAYEWKSNK